MNLESLHKLIEYLITVTLLSLNMYPHEYLPLITTCHPIQSLNCSNNEKPRLRSCVQPKITEPARIEWIRFCFSLIPALFVSFRCIGRGHNAVCPEKLGNWQLTTGKHNPRRLFTGKLITSIFCLVDKNLEQLCCDQSNRNVRHLICKVAWGKSSSIRSHFPFK